MGDRVYIKRYSKAGAPYKLVFTAVDGSSGRRIVTTSFLVPKDRLELFVKFPPLWEKIKGQALKPQPFIFLPIALGPGILSDFH